MGTMIASGTDVVSFLKEQHQQVKALFETVLAAQGEEREKAFYSLRRMLAVHETAEEEIVHPAARRSLADGEQIVNARLQEENEAKKVLAELEKLDCGSIEFETKFRAFQQAVIAHAESEETQEFDRLASVLDQSQLTKMKKAAEVAEAIAPTRPHAGVESAIGNMIAGPFVSMVDRARDAIAGKTGS
jgi:hemerythrin superfamily protein